MNFRPLAAVLQPICVEWDTCDKGSKLESIMSLLSL